MEYLHIKDYITIIIQSSRQPTGVRDFSLPMFHENKTENLNGAPPGSSSTVSEPVYVLQKT